MKKVGAGYFNRQYWLDGTKSGYSQYSFFRGDHLHQAKALMLQALYGGRKWLIAGCARGWTVEQLLNLDIDVYGFDISKWAVKNSPDIARDRLAVSNGLDVSLYNLCSFDVIATFETTEHIHSDDISVWLKNLHAWLRPGGKLFATVCLGSDDIRGIDDNDKSHQTLRTRSWWNDEIENAGFVQDDKTYTKALGTVVTTKEREINIVEEMDWNIFAYEKVGVS